MRRQSDAGSAHGGPAHDDPERNAATDQRSEPGDVGIRARC
jgi:hypothetical protein